MPHATLTPEPFEAPTAKEDDCWRIGGSLEGELEAERKDCPTTESDERRTRQRRPPAAGFAGSQ